MVPRSDVGGTLLCDLFHDALDATYRGPPPPQSAWHVLTAHTHCSGRSRGAPPRTKIFLISCSFWGKSDKFVCWRPPSPENPRSAPASNMKPKKFSYELHLKSPQTVVWITGKLYLYEKSAARIRLRSS